MISKLVDHLVEMWQKRCVHDDNHVVADILEGCGNYAVKYCCRCGAVRPSYAKEWRNPRPTWYPKLSIIQSNIRERIVRIELGKRAQTECEDSEYERKGCGNRIGSSSS